jgi:hypothetical protein
VADTTFVNTVTLSDADWFNDVNRLHYTYFGDPASEAAAFNNLMDGVTSSITIGAAADTTVKLNIAGAFTSSGANTRGLAFTSTLTPGADSGVIDGFLVNPIAVERSAGTHARISALRVAMGDVTAGAAATTTASNISVATFAAAAGTVNAAGIHIEGAPTGATNNYALWVDANVLRCDGPLLMGELSPTSISDGEIGLANGAAIRWRNAANSGWLNGISVDANNDLLLGGGGATSKTLFGVTGIGEVGRFTLGGYLKASNDGTYIGATSTYHEIKSTLADVTCITSNSHASTPYGARVYFSAATPDNNTQYFLQCDDNTTIRCIIYSDGDILNHDGTYGTISDRRFKNNVIPANSQWNDVKALSAAMVNYETEFSPGKRLLGWEAQAAQAISPGVVRTVKWNNEDALATDDMTILKKGFKAIGEMMARIEALEAR